MAIKSQWRLILFVLCDLLNCNALSSPTLSALKLTPVQCPGQYTLPSGTCIPAVFLSKPQLEVLQSDAVEDQDKALLRDVVPILIPDDPVRVVASLAGGNRADPFANSITVRDNGLYDNLPYDWVDIPLAKKLIYDAVQAKNNGNGHDNMVVAQFDSFHQTMQQKLELTITGLLVEVEDSFPDGTVTLGGAAIVARNDCTEEFDPESVSSKTSKSSIRLPDSEAVRSQSATVVECYLDEVVGLSLALDLPIFISPQLFEKVSLNAMLVKADEEKRQPMKAISPVPVAFLRRLKGVDKYASTSKKRKKTPDDENREEEDVDDAPPAWEIFDPEQFLSMPLNEKRAILRSSGARSIPRPRLGKDAVDLMLLEYMDDAVREEVMWLSNGNFGGEEGVARYNELMMERIEAASAGRGAPVSGAGGGAIAFKLFDDRSSSQFDDQDPEDLMLASERRRLLSGIGKALKEGDLSLAERLRAEFATRTRLRADPTQADGSYDRFLDQDSWYEEARRRAMRSNNKKPSSS